MARYLLRLWLPDRPGALGAVASRIGTVRGDVVGIDILEHGGGRAIDELVVELPGTDLVDLLLAEVRQVDGVDVEDVRPAPDHLTDPRLDALETAAVLVAERTAGGLLATLVGHAGRYLEADWATVIDPAEPGLLAAMGGTPDPRWLQAYLSGSSVSDQVAAGQAGPDDMASAVLASAGLALLLGRRGRPFRVRERRQLDALAKVADARWFDFGGRVPAADLAGRSGFESR